MGLCAMAATGPYHRNLILPINLLELKFYKRDFQDLDASCRMNSNHSGDFFPNHADRVGSRCTVHVLTFNGLFQRTTWALELPYAVHLAHNAPSSN